MPEVARICPFPLNSNQSETTSIWLLTSQISREIEAAASNPDVLLCDRGIPDILAHLEEVCRRGDSQIIASVRQFVNAWCSSYDLVLVSRIDHDVAIVPDGLRVADESYRRLMEEFSDTILSSLKMGLALPNSIDERVSYAVELISSRFVGE